MSGQARPQIKSMLVSGYPALPKKIDSKAIQDFRISLILGQKDIFSL